MLSDFFKIKKKTVINYLILFVLLFFINFNFGLNDRVLTLELFISFTLVFAIFHVYYNRKNKYPLFIIYHIGIFAYYVLPGFYFMYLQKTWLFNTQILKTSFNIKSIRAVIFLIIIIQLISLLMVLIKKEKYFARKNNGEKLILKKNASIITTIIVLILLTLGNIIDSPIFLQLKVLLDNLVYIPVAFFLYQYLGTNKKRDLFFLILNIGIISISFLARGAAAPFAELGIFIVIILILEGRPPKLWHYLTGISLLSFIMLFKMSFRAVFWSGDYSISEKIDGAFRIMASTLSEGINVVVNSINFLLIRTQALSLFIIITSLTPNKVPYWHFSQIRFMLWAFIPRFIIPSKPKNYGGQLFGHAYSIIGAHDFVTAVNIPSLIGFYLVTGVFSLILGVVFFNWIMLKVEDIYKKNRHNQSVIIAITYFSVQFIHSLDTGFVGIGNYIYKSIIIYLVSITLYKYLFYKEKQI